MPQLSKLTSPITPPGLQRWLVVEATEIDLVPLLCSQREVNVLFLMSSNFTKNQRSDFIYAYQLKVTLCTKRGMY